MCGNLILNEELITTCPGATAVFVPSVSFIDEIGKTLPFGKP